MEIALLEEVDALPLPRTTTNDALPVPKPPNSCSTRLPEIVTHPDLVPLLRDDLSPPMLINAATALKEQSLDGADVSGQVALFKRCVRPRLCQLRPVELEHLATAISYVAIDLGSPFFSLEWLGHVLSQVGITDRTFTILINTSEAASLGGYQSLANRIDRFFTKLRTEWEIPATQIAQVEHAEVEQQRLMASAFHYEHIGRRQHDAGDLQGAVDSLQLSVSLATESTRLAHRILTDTSAFPNREVEGKARHHGGDLVWPWALAAALRILEPASALQQLVGPLEKQNSGIASSIQTGLVVAKLVLSEYDEPITIPRFHRWYGEVESGVTVLTGS